MVDRHLGQQPLKPSSILSIAAALTLIFVNDQDSICGPSQGNGIIDQAVLAQPGFTVLQNLLRTRLPNVNDGQALQMPTLNLG